MQPNGSEFHFGIQFGVGFVKNKRERPWQAET
jgi:hypothetical protein